MSVTSQRHIHILHVDDNPTFADRAGTFLQREDDRFAVETASSADEGLRLIDDHPPACVVSDYNLPGRDGLEFLQAVREEYPDLPFVLFTGEGSETVASDAIAAGVTDYLQKQSDTGQYELLANRIRNVVRARRETQRADRQEQLMQLTEFAGNTGGFELDMETGNVLLTAGARRIIGGPDRPEIPLAEAIELFNPDDPESIQHTLDRALQTGEKLHDTWRFQPEGGDERLLKVTITPVVENGEVTTLRGAGHDITERKERERELRRKSLALDEAPVGITIADPTRADNPLVYVNDRFQEMTGYDSDEVLGRNCRFLQGEQTDPEPVATLRENIDAERQVSVDLRNYRNDGTVFWNHLEIAPVHDDSGNLVSYVGFQQDVTDRKRREKALEKSRNRYRTLLENFPDGAVALVDENLRYLTVGGVTVDTVDSTPSELEGEPIEEALPPDVSDLVVPHYTAALAGECRSFEAAIGDRDYLFRVVPVRNDGGDVFAVMGVSQDVTGQRKRQRELVETKKRLDVILEETKTGMWSFELGDNTIDPVGTVSELFGLESGATDSERYIEQIYPEDKERVRTSFETAARSGTDLNVEFRTGAETTDRWLHARGSVIEGTDGRRRLVGITTDVTERARREAALEKRERILRELHAATRELYPLESTATVAQFVVEFLGETLDLGYASVKLFDESEGALQPTVRSSSDDEMADALGTISPGPNPIWDAYRTDTPRVIDGAELADVFTGTDVPITQLLVVPIGDFGVAVAFQRGDETFDEVDVDIAEVVVANAHAAFRKLQSDSERATLADELSTRRTQIDELQQVVETTQRIQEQATETETRDGLEQGICAELTSLGCVDFAWIGRPEITDTELAPTASAGDGERYLDAVLTGSVGSSYPARQAAARHDAISLPELSQNVSDSDWAKDALSFGFNSVLSVPVLFEDVLYAVVTVYSKDTDGFADIHERLLTDAASLLQNYTRLLEQRQFASDSVYTSLEFEFADESCQLQRLAATSDSEIEYQTLIEQTEDDATISVSVDAEGVEQVCESAADLPGIVDVSRVGNRETGHLTLTISKPFVVTAAKKHGGRVVGVVSDPDSTTIRVEAPATAAKRPLLDFLTSSYADIELRSQQESLTREARGGVTRPDTLTERQYDVLNAAYQAGYYETPREITGEELADMFGISGPAIHRHLQTGHRKVLARRFESVPDIDS